MSEEKNSYVSLEKLADYLGVTPKKLFEDYKAFNGTLPSNEALGEKTVGKALTKGLSFRNSHGQNVFRSFLDANFPNEKNLADRVARDFFRSVDEQNANATTPFSDKQLSENRQLFDSLVKMFAIRSSNSSLNADLEDYAGHYYLVRKTSRDDKLPYYEEPFRLSGNGEDSYLIPLSQGQGLHTGFSFASVGISTTVLFHRHKTRTLGMRVIMLYGDNDPEKSGITGVMLRFSDDTARPVASQVLARRLGDEALASEWDEAVELHYADERATTDYRLPDSAVKELARFVRTVDETNDPDGLLDVYRAFSLEHHSKAFDGRQWDEAAGKIKLTGQELADRLQKK